MDPDGSFGWSMSPEKCSPPNPGSVSGVGGASSALAAEGGAAARRLAVGPSLAATKPLVAPASATGGAASAASGAPTAAAASAGLAAPPSSAEKRWKGRGCLPGRNRPKSTTPQAIYQRKRCTHLKSAKTLAAEETAAAVFPTRARGTALVRCAPSSSSPPSSSSLSRTQGMEHDGKGPPSPGKDPPANGLTTTAETAAAASVAPLPSSSESNKSSYYRGPKHWGDRHPEGLLVMTPGAIRAREYRAKKKAVKLEEREIARLAMWEDMIERLRKYKNENGHCRVPNNYSLDKKLGAWVRKQRTEYRKLKQGNSTYLTKDRMERLQNLSFEWKLQEQCSWETMFEKLRAYKNENGHCRVPQRYALDKKLGTWVGNQRSAYRRLKQGKPSYLTKDQIERLESLSFEWKLKELCSWETMFEKLRAYRYENGHCRVPPRYALDKNLGMWVYTQRYQYARLMHGKPSLLTKNRIECLESLSFEW